MSNFSDKVAFIWSVADLLRGPYKPHQYGRVILPLTVLRRLDSVLEPTKAKVLEKHGALKSSGIKDVEPILNRSAGLKFHNTSKLDFAFNNPVREIWFGFDRDAGERFFFAPLPEWHTEALQHNIQVARVPYWMSPGEPPTPLSFAGWLGSRSPVVILAAGCWC